MWSDWSVGNVTHQQANQSIYNLRVNLFSKKVQRTMLFFGVRLCVGADIWVRGVLVLGLCLDL
jgi:hypothetical protein